MGGVDCHPETLWCRSGAAPSVFARHVTFTRLANNRFVAWCVHATPRLVDGWPRHTSTDGSALRSRQSLIDDEYFVTLFFGEHGDTSEVTIR